MKNETFVKIYRKISYNDELWRDSNACRIFFWVLINADHKTGTYITGRFFLGELLNVNPMTAYKALKRLHQKYHLINIKSNNKCSTISIVNYHKYNGNGNSKNESEISEQVHQSNTIQEVKKVKNKELNNKQTIQNFFDSFSIKGEGYEAVVTYLVNKGYPEQPVRAEITKFVSYWTEPNHAGTKQRWEMEKTFEVQRRLINWLSRAKMPAAAKKGVSYDN